MKLSSASRLVLSDLSSGPKRLFALSKEVYGWRALEKLGLVERFGNEILGWARLTPKGEEFTNNMKNLNESKQQFKSGDKVFFEYHCLESEESSDAEAWHHTCQWVTIVRKLSEDEVDPEIVGGMYRVKFDDGIEWDVFSDELFRREQKDCKPWCGKLSESKTITINLLQKQIEKLRDPERNPTYDSSGNQIKWTKQSWINPQWRQNLMRSISKKQESAVSWRLVLISLMEKLGVDQLIIKDMCKKMRSAFTDEEEKSGIEHIFVDCSEAEPHQDYIEVDAFYHGDKMVAYRKKVGDKRIKMLENKTEKSDIVIFTEDDALEVGKILDIDWDEIDLEEFIIGMNVELEHGSQDKETNVTDDDPIETAKIVLAHINEDSKYYSNPMPKNWGKKEAEKRKMKESVEGLSDDELFLKAEDIYTRDFPVTYRWHRGYFWQFDNYLLLVADVNYDIEFENYDIRDFHVVNVENDKDITNELDDKAIDALKDELILNINKNN